MSNRFPGFPEPGVQPEPLDERPPGQHGDDVARVTAVEFDSGGPGGMPQWQLTVHRVPRGLTERGPAPRAVDIPIDVRLALRGWLAAADRPTSGR